MKKKETRQLPPAQLYQILEKTLATMIDEWYENVCSYYATEISQGESQIDPELKRFHDDKGHRIKFAKEALQCTYGLRALKDGSDNRIEISVNNKSEAFDYGEFLTRLGRYYQDQSARQHKPHETNFTQIFVLESDFRQAFSVERSEGKADVARLSFLVDPIGVAALVEEPNLLKAGIEEYCLSPMRRIYAELYRRSRR